MGIHGIYKEIGPGRRVALSKLAVEKFEETGRPLRIAIDVSIWLFQIQASKGGTNPALRTFYYRLLRLIALSIHPVFVFDGPNKPPFKRNKRTGPNVASIPEFLAKQLLKQFGFPIHLAPGEAEAECALLQREGIVDAVLSEDVDTLMFGSGLTIRNWSPEQKTSKTPTHVNVYDAVETKNGPSRLDREGMILVALMSGGDYVPEGIPGCGPKTACEAAKAGFGHDLCKIARNDSGAMREWRERLQHELKTNESKLFNRKRPSLKIPDDFPRIDILGYYTHPAISTQAGLDKLRRSINWDQDLDFPGLRAFTYDAFDWVKLEGAKHFVRSLAPSLLVRHLRLRGEQSERFPTEDLQAIQEDEALLVKGIHGKREHMITDSTTELRLSFTPIELVKIDLSKEEPDEDADAFPPGSQAPDADLDDEVPLELEDEEGPKKRGPTKFDPHKPARIWVLETFAKVGVPLKVQDWEAARQKPAKAKRTATTNDTAATKSKPRVTRRAKTTGDAPPSSISSFAKVTKPGVKLSRALSKSQFPPSDPRHASTQPSRTVVEIFSSSPVRSSHNTVLAQQPHDKSLSSVQEELPSSVTKRRRRAPIQRSQTLPSDIATTLNRPSAPLCDSIEILDLVDLPTLPSPSQVPAKKTKTRALRNPPPTRAARGTSVTSSPGRTRQTTLDAWCSSPAASPTRPRRNTPPVYAAPVPVPPDLRPKNVEIDELDLTLSSPSLPSTTRNCSATNLLSPGPRTHSDDVAELDLTGFSPSRVSRTMQASIRDRSQRTPTTASSPRPPLVSISSNMLNQSSSSSSHESTGPKSKREHIAQAGPRTSPRLNKRKSPSPTLDVESLDLTQISSPAASPPPAPIPVEHPVSRVPRQVLTATLRRSPRNHASASPEPATRKLSPPAAWKTQAKKKREIILRKSLAGAWDFVEADSLAKSAPDLKMQESDNVVLKGKERRRWRESEIEVLDLC